MATQKKNFSVGDQVRIASRLHKYIYLDKVRVENRIAARIFAIEVTASSVPEGEDTVLKILGNRYFQMVIVWVNEYVPKWAKCSTATAHTDETVDALQVAYANATEENDGQDLAVKIDDFRPEEIFERVAAAPALAGSAASGSGAAAGVPVGTTNKSKIHEHPPNPDDFQGDTKRYIAELKEWSVLAKASAPSEAEVVYYLKRSISEKAGVDYTVGHQDTVDRFLAKYQEWLFPDKLQQVIDAFTGLNTIGSIDSAENPKTWLTQITRYRAELRGLNIDFGEEAFGMLVLYLAGLDGGSKIAVLAALQTKANPHRYDTVREVLESVLGKSDTGLLNMAKTGGQGGPWCYRCKKQGHIASNCPTKKGDSPGGKKGKGKKDKK